MANPEAQHQEENSELQQVDYGSQLNNFTQKIEQITAALTDDPTENDVTAIIEWQELIKKCDDSFKEYLKNNPEQTQKLKDTLWQSIQKIVDKFKNDNGWTIPDELSPLLKFAASIWIRQKMEVWENDVKKIPEFDLKGADFQWIETEWQDQGYFKWKNEKVWINEIEEWQEKSELDETMWKIKDQIDKINAIDVSKLTEGDKWKIQQITQLLNNIMGKKSPDNVKILQKFISENLSGEDKTNFDAKSYSKKSNDFDGKFGRGTLEWLNKVLEKIWSYIDAVVNLNQTETSDVSDKSEVKPENDTAEKTDQSPLDEKPLEFGGNKYPIMENNSDIASKARLQWAIFYSTTVFKEDWPQLSNTTLLNNWEKEYYLKLSNKPEILYKVKVDDQWNLCPLAIEINSRLVDKNRNSAEMKILFGNNDSCKAYLQNKMPEAIKSECTIWWNNDKQDYTLTSHSRTLTIEPMTIAWDWISEDLWRSLAFLNLTNYVRSLWNKKDKDPDVNKKLKVKWLKDSNGKKLFIDKQSFGLENALPEELNRFKKYNNGEDWRDNWDKKWDNKGFKKMDFPSIKVNIVKQSEINHWSTVYEWNWNNQILASAVKAEKPVPTNHWPVEYKWD